MVFFGNSSSSYSNWYFQAFVEAPCRLVGVVDAPPAARGLSTALSTESSASFIAHARALAIPTFEPQTPNQPAFVAAVRALQPDIFVAAGYMGIFREEILAVPRVLAVNFHASLLPAYRGKHPVFWALRNGERWTGLTVHVIDRGVDTGDILYQVRVRTRRDDTVATVYARVFERTAWIPRQLILDVENNTLRRRPQPQAGATYYSSVREEDFILDWHLPAAQLGRMIRISPGRCFANVRGRRVFFWDGRAIADTSNAVPGSLLHVGRGAGTIKTGEGALRVQKVSVVETDKVIPFARLCRQWDIQPTQQLV